MPPVALDNPIQRYLTSHPPPVVSVRSHWFFCFASTSGRPGRRPDHVAPSDFNRNIQRGHMYRKRLAAVCVLASVAFAGGVVSPETASAQEVINLDEEGGADQGGAPPAGGQQSGSGVDIDLDEGAPKAQEPVVAGTMTEGAAAAKKMFDKERWSEAAAGMYRVVS